MKEYTLFSEDLWLLFIINYLLSINVGVENL